MTVAGRVCKPDSGAAFPYKMLRQGDSYSALGHKVCTLLLIIGLIESGVFMDISTLLLTAARASAVYLFVLVVVRLLGKREIGNLGAFDLIVALMIGEVVDEVIYGDVSLLQGFVAIGVVAAWHVVNSWTSFKSKTIEKLTNAPPTVVIEHGEMKMAALARERLSKEELEAQLRLNEIDDIKEVKKAMLESDGEISFILEEWAKPLQKGDIKQMKNKAA